MIFNINDPIPYSVKDTDEISSFIRKAGIVPPYGTDENSSFAFQNLVATLCKLSPTFGSVSGDLGWYTFGLNAQIVSGVRPGLAGEPQPLPMPVQIQYEDYLASLNIRLIRIMKTLRRIDYFLLTNGNAYLHLKRIQVNGLVRYEINAPHYNHCAYLLSRDAQEEFIVISKFLTDHARMQKYGYTVLRATQTDEPLKWMKTGKGIEEAVLHIKADGGQTNASESDFYGRPEILSCLDWLYCDFQAGSLSSKILSTEIISKKIIAFMEQDPNTSPNTDFDSNQAQEIDAVGYIGKPQKDFFKENMLILKALTTNLGGHPSEVGASNAATSIAGIEVPFGSAPPTVIDLEMNRDTKDIEWRLETATTEICSSLRWAPELISFRPAKATLGGNLLYDIFTTKDTVTIQPRQQFYEDIINTRLQEILDREGQTKTYPNFGIKFPEVIQNLVKSLRKTGITIAVPGTGTGTPIADPTITKNNDDEIANDPDASN